MFNLPWLEETGMVMFCIATGNRLIVPCEHWWRYGSSMIILGIYTCMCNIYIYISMHWNHWSSQLSDWAELSPLLVFTNLDWGWSKLEHHPSIHPKTYMNIIWYDMNLFDSIWNLLMWCISRQKKTDYFSEYRFFFASPVDDQAL